MVDLTDVTFTIPVCVDSDDRKNNLIIVIDYLLSKFDTNIIVCEEDTQPRCINFWKDEWKERNCVLMYRQKAENTVFYKTKNLNMMARKATTPIIVSMDSDVLFPSQQYVKARDIIKAGNADFVYPFNRPTLDIPQKYHEKIVEAQSVLGFEKYIKPKHPGIAPGGCLFMRRDKFFEYGMENENFMGWGPEDRERCVRFEKLGGRFTNVLGFLYHLSHRRTIVSRTYHNYSDVNNNEFVKINNMPADTLRQYVDKWPWLGDK